MYPHWRKAPTSETEWLEAIVSLARFLRGPEGCPWDREKNARDFAEYAREEAAELIEAFESGGNAAIEEELGDTLFCLLGVVAAAEAEGRFTLEEALHRMHEKLIRRHDHVFGEERASTPEEAVDRWNQVKARERGEQGEGI